MPHLDTSSIATLPIDPHLLTVSCPRRACEVPYDDCRSCGHGWLVHVDSEHGSSFVICEVLPSADPKRAVASMSEARVTPVAEIMTREVISVQRSLRVERLIDEDIGAVPVVEGGRLIGMVSRDDLFTDDYDWADLRDDFLSYPRTANSADGDVDAMFPPELLRSKCVADLMTSTVVRLPVSASVADAAAAIDANRVHEVILVDAFGGVAGVVSKSDIVRWVGAAAGSD